MALAATEGPERGGALCPEKAPWRRGRAKTLRNRGHRDGGSGRQWFRRENNCSKDSDFPVYWELRSERLARGRMQRIVNTGSGGCKPHFPFSLPGRASQVSI